MSLGKLTVRGQTKLSLHDRFTTLRKLGPLDPHPEPPVQRVAPPLAPSRPALQRSRSYGGHDSDMMMNGGDRRDYRQSASMSMSLARRQSERSQRSSAQEMAMKLKKRSLKQRLGNSMLYRPPFSSRMNGDDDDDRGYNNDYGQHNNRYNNSNTGRYPYRGNYRYSYFSRGSRGRGYLDRTQNRWSAGGGGGQRRNLNKRWGSSASLNNTFRSGGGGPQRFNLNRKWGSSVSLNNSFGGGRFRGRRGYRGQQRGNRGRGFRRGGFRGRGGGFRKGPMPKKEDLDKEIDQYMAGAKVSLDKDLEDYMSKAA